MTLIEQINDFKPKLKTLSGQEHLAIQNSNDYRKLAWHAYYMETLEDYRKKLISEDKYSDKQKQAIDTEIASIQADYDELFELLSES